MTQTMVVTGCRSGFAYTGAVPRPAYQPPFDTGCNRVIGVTARTFRDPQHPGVTGLIFAVPDMDRFQSLMASDEAARAMEEDGLKVETVRVLSEITP